MKLSYSDKNEDNVYNLLFTSKVKGIEIKSGKDILKICELVEPKIYGLKDD